MRPFLALLVLLVAGSGCSSRERSNPFDPGNPSTRGHPIAFAALAGDGYATLTWQAVSGSGLVGYQAFRRAEGESSFRAISDVIPPQLTRFTDFRLQLRPIPAMNRWAIFIRPLNADSEERDSFSKALVERVRNANAPSE